MAKGFHKTQLDMFRESARRTQTYFQLDWPSDCKPLASFPVDAVTPWYQVKMQAMSTLERQATIAILEMNANKPVSTPFTLDDFCAQSTLSLTLRFRKSIRGGVMKKQ